MAELKRERNKKMREILFRGRSIKTREWYQGGIINIEFNLPPYVPGIVVGESGDYAYTIIDVDPDTVGQFTGLTDKNGKKIFEGDRCRVSRPCVLAYGKITYQNGCFWFVDDGPGGMLRLCDAKTNGFEVKVIGNVHDTMELSEGK